MRESSRLQETRKESIKTLVEKYKKLVDETYEACGKPLPVFENLKDKDDVVISTAEEQLFAFIDVRNKALDTANRILVKVNDLEIELYAPELLKNENEDECEEKGTTNWAKKNAK